MMKRIFAAGATVAALLAFAGQAGAADLARRQQMPVKAPYLEQIYNWTGFYVGINGGGGFGRSSWDGGVGSFDPSGGIVGGTVGYNYQVGQAVFGVEGDIDWSDMKSSSACTLGVCQTRNDWLGTARGRLGYAFDRFMPYVTGGVAFGNVKTNIVGLPTHDDTKVGWTVGAGVEAAIAQNWTAKVEYLYVDLGNTTCSVASCGVATNADFRSNIVRAGLNYRF